MNAFAPPPHDLFDRLRPRLKGIAYRMLGTVADAEDVVQDAWLRWHEADRDTLITPEAWLVTVTTRLAIDRLRTAQQRRENYVGFWLPEPLLDEPPATPEQTLEWADDLSVAFLTVLERLAPEARAAFLLREVFDADYAEVAQAIGKSEAACRQIVHRAKTQLRDARPRHAVSPDTHRRLLGGFVEAARLGNFAGLQAMLADDAELISDGGGKVPSFGKVLGGGRRIAQLFFANWRRHGPALRLEMVHLNGRWGLPRFVNGTLESAHAFDIEDGDQGGRIVRIHVQRNPDKLQRLAHAWSVTTQVDRPS